MMPKRTGTPQETVHLDAADLLLELLHVGLVIPRLDVQDDRRLGNDDRL